MQEFHEGDLVEAVKGETVIRGRLKHVPDTGSRPVLNLTVALNSDTLHLEANGFTVTVIEKAAPPLPTEPGTVIAIGGWELVKLRLYNAEQPGGWELLPAKDDQVRRSMDRAGVKAQCVYGDEWVRAEAEQDRDGFRVISEPAPITAKRVLASVELLYGSRSRVDLLAEVAAEFGVTE